jgi:hypothetical protein
MKPLKAMEDGTPSGKPSDLRTNKKWTRKVRKAVKRHAPVFAEVPLSPKAMQCTCFSQRAYPRRENCRWHENLVIM